MIEKIDKGSHPISKPWPKGSSSNISSAESGATTSLSKASGAEGVAAPPLSEAAPEGTTLSLKSLVSGTEAACEAPTLTSEKPGPGDDAPNSGAEGAELEGKTPLAGSEGRTNTIRPEDEGASERSAAADLAKERGKIFQTPKPLYFAVAPPIASIHSINSSSNHPGGAAPTLISKSRSAPRERITAVRSAPLGIASVNLVF